MGEGLTPQDSTEHRFALEVRGISKHFTGTVALADVSVTVRVGAVHALIGENGSGKSTLIKVLAGVHMADSGTIIIRGQSHDAREFTPAAARAAGLRFVHQDLGVFDDMSVAENFALQIGYPRTALGSIDRGALNRQTEAALARLELAIRPQTRIAELAAADRAMVAIARALHDSSRNSRILILDEPTASLPDREAQRLLEGLRRLARTGQAIVFVSHKLQEVLEVADRVTVLRDGRVAGDLSVADCDERQLIALIAGAPPEEPALAAAGTLGRSGPAVRVEGLWSGRLRGIDLQCGRGEIVGILGLLGSGRSRLLRALAGDVRPERGTIEVGGARLELGSTARAAARGIAFVAEQRTQTIFGDMPVRSNLSITTLDRYRRRGLLRRSAEAAAVADTIRRYQIRTRSDSVPASQLSGGNQQKLVLARTLAAEPKVLLLDEPTVGVDVVARAQIHGIIRRAATAGAAVLVVSSDTDELAQLSDRVLVLSGGRIVRQLDGRDANPSALVEALHSSREEVPL